MLKTPGLRSGALIACLAVGVAVAAGAGAQENAIPNFSSIDSGWLLQGGIDFRPIPGKTAPVSFDPAYPQVGTGNQRGVMERMSDAENANLKPWAKELMRKYNQDVLNGHRAFSSQSRCWPGGTPGQLLFPAEPIFFVQTPKEVWIIWQRQQEVRRIYLNVPHSRNPKPSWFGESVGHYEGDTLVVDTIGIAPKVAGYQSLPHSNQLRVTERIRLTGPDVLQDQVTLDDPVVLEKPVTYTLAYKRLPNYEMVEFVCDNNREFTDDNGVVRMKVLEK